MNYITAQRTTHRAITKCLDNIQNLVISPKAGSIPSRNDRRTVTMTSKQVHSPSRWPQQHLLKHWEIFIPLQCLILKAYPNFYT